MKTRLLIFALILALVGLVWIGQGLALIKGGATSGSNLSEVH